ncbi:MAG: DUF58 domain-containing protein [Bdellovibrionaceae bacterium]|nr:DUF58 domain-containing protein [Pseudobdellovibrionaceae bacterium]
MKLWRLFSYPSQRIYMIPNRYGLIACCFFLLCTIVAAHYANNLIFLLAFILISFLLIAILQTAKNLRGVQIQKIYIHDGFPDSHSIIDLQINNLRNVFKFGLGFQIKEQTSVTYANELNQNDQILTTGSFVLPKKRGLYSINRIKVFTDAPYGLFHGWQYHYISSSYVVFPKPRGFSLSFLKQLSPGNEFSGLREYIPGDSLSRVSWKHSVKSSTLLLKEFKEQEPQQQIFSLTDCPQIDLENKLSQLSLWIIEAENHQLRYGLHLLKTVIPIGHGPQHLRKCLSSLGAYQP